MNAHDWNFRQVCNQTQGALSDVSQQGFWNDELYINNEQLLLLQDHKPNLNYQAFHMLVLHITMIEDKFIEFKLAIQVRNSGILRLKSPNHFNTFVITSFI